MDKIKKNNKQTNGSLCNYIEKLNTRNKKKNMGPPRIELATLRSPAELPTTSP